MKEIKLSVNLRDVNIKAKDLKKQKMVPWIVYWKNKENISIQIDSSSLLKTYRKAWESQIINLELDWKKIEVLIHNFQKHPVTWDFIHIDFYAITRWEKVTTNVSIEFKWAAPAAKEWAIIEEVLKEIEMKVLPKDLLNFISVDLTKLKEVGDMIRVEDLELDEKKFEILTPADEIIVIASEPKKVVIEETEETNSEEKIEEETNSEEKTEEETK